MVQQTMAAVRAVSIMSVLLAGAFALGACDSAEERIEEHYKRGLELVEQGEHRKANLEFRNALTLNNQYVPALFELAKSEQRLGNLRNAAGIYIRVIEAAPEHVEARVALGNILLLAGQLDEALKYANQAYGLAPGNAEVLVIKAAVELKLENTKEAVRFADEALKLDPQNLDALMVKAAERLSAGEPKAALAFLDLAEENSSRNVGLQYFRMRTLAALKDRDGIEAVLEKLIGYYPENEQFRYMLARWYRGSNANDKAEEVLRKLAADQPENTRAGLALVSYLAQTRGVEAAGAELTRRIGQGTETFLYEVALAELRFGNGEHEAAFKILEKVIAGKGASEEGTRARVLLARMKINRKALPEAEELLNAVLAEDEKHADALSLLASIRIADKNYERAVEHLLVALNEQPDSTPTLLLLARAYELEGSVELAEEQLAKAARVAKFAPNVALPYVQFLMRYGKGEQAERVLDESRRAAPKNRQVLTQLAQLRLARQDWVGAQEMAETIRKLDNADGLADRIQAEVLAGQKKFDESNTFLEGALDDATDAGAPVTRYVQNLVQNGKSDKAREFVNEILSTNPDNVRARILLASLHEAAGEQDAAEAAFKKAVEHDDGVAAYQALARFYLRRKTFDAAEKALRTALARQDSLSLRLLLAAMLERTERIDDAIREYEIMYEAAPQSTVIANNLASLLADYRDSEQDLTKAYDIAIRFRSSNVPQFLDTLGWIQYRRGEYEQAVTLLKTASEKLGDLELVHYHLGMTYKALGQKDLAVDALSTAISLANGKAFAQLESAEAALEELRAAPQAEN